MKRAVRPGIDQSFIAGSGGRPACSRLHGFGGCSLSHRCCLCCRVVVERRSGIEFACKSVSKTLDIPNLSRACTPLPQTFTCMHWQARSTLILQWQHPVRFRLPRCCGC